MKIVTLQRVTLYNRVFRWLICVFIVRVPSFKDNQTVNDGVAHSKNPRKCAYHVTFDLEHTLDARWPGVHLVKVWWRSGHLSARRSDLRKSLQTDGRRTPRHCISSFLEWAKNDPDCTILCLSFCVEMLGPSISWVFILCNIFFIGLPMVTRISYWCY